MAMNVPMALDLSSPDAATEAAVMILRIDDVIATKGSKGGAGAPPETYFPSSTAAATT